MDTYTSSSYYSDYGCEAAIDTRHSASNVPYAKPEVIETTIINDVSASQPAERVLTGREKSLKNLRPYKKGETGNPTGKQGIRLKDVMKKRLMKKNAENIIDNIIAEAEKGDDKKQDRLLKLTGDLDETPQVSINNNTINISEDIIEAAKQFIANQQIKKIE